MAGARMHAAAAVVAAFVMLMQPARPLEFQRGAVEKRPPEALENAHLSVPEQLVRVGAAGFGTRRLPLREAVEHELTPHEKAEVRIPLRDAVESRPSPDVNRFTRPFSGIEYDPAALPPNYHLIRGGAAPGDFPNNEVEVFDVEDESIASVPEPRLRPARVVCYLQSWAAHRRQPMRFTTSDIDPFLCTHLVYAFASLDPHSLHIVPQDEEFDIVKGGYRTAMGLKRQNPSLKVMISLGGWVEVARRYSQMASTAATRREFIRSVIYFLDQHGFDGLDLHWTFPGATDLGGRTDDVRNFVLLTEALSEVFATRGWLLSASVSPSRFRIEDGYDVPMLSRYLDFINVKAYDMHNENEKFADHLAPLYRRVHDRGLSVFFNIDYAMRYWQKKGAPSSKLVMGIPFFGRSFTLVNASNPLPPAPITGKGKEGKYTLEKGLMAYFEICEQLLDNGPQDGGGSWRRETDDIGSPFMVRRDQWVGYDDASSIGLKMEYIRKHQLGGAAVWAVDMDDFQGFCGEKWPLLTAVKEGLENRAGESVAGVAGPPAVPVAPTQAPVAPTEAPVVQPIVVEEEQQPVVTEAPPTVIVVPTPGTEVSLGPGHGCTGKGFIGDPSNCRVYYRCEWGTKTTYVCPEGLHFDKTLNLCNWPQRAGCEQIINVQDKIVLTPLQQFLLRMQTPNFHLPEYLPPPPQYQRISAQYLPQPYRLQQQPYHPFFFRQAPAAPSHQVQHFANDCHFDGLYSDPKDCKNYIWCRNGDSFTFKCPNDTYFSFKTAQCEEGDPATFCAPPSHASRISNQPDPSTVSPLNAGGRLIGEKDYRVVCYFTNWAWYRKSTAKFYPEHLDPRLCTHIIYAFAALEPRELQIISSDPWADIENNFYLRVTSLPEPRRGDGKVKVLLSIGGWTDSSGEKYSRLVSEGGSRRRFVAGAVAFLRRHNFGGLHLDWQYPKCWQSNCAKGPDSDKPNFTKLIQELKHEFDKQQPPMVLAVAISGYKEVIDVAYDVPEISKYVEFMSVMTYDYHGAWERKTGHVSPLYYRQGDRFAQYNTNFTLEYLASLGADREKLLVGVPFYGQSYTLASTDTSVGAPTSGPGNPGEYTQQPGMLAYYEVCDRIRSQGWRVEKDNLAATGPYAYYGDQWVGFEDVESVKEKARYIRNMGYGGAMVWTVDLDDFTNRCCREPFPLLRALNRVLDRLNGEREPANGDCTKPPEISTPAPPTLTTGVDTGASTEASTTPIHVHPTQPESTTSSSWSTEKPTTAQPVITTSSPWWTQPATTPSQSTTTSPWWVQSTTAATAAPTTQATQPPTPAATTPSTTTTTTERQTQPPTAQPSTTQASVDMPCSPGEHHPDPTNCNAYYRCIIGKLKKEYCAGGLHWSANLHACDWPSKAGCQVELAPAPGPAVIGGGISTTTNSPWWTTSSTTLTPPWWPHQPPTTDRPDQWWTHPTQPTQPPQPSSSSISNFVDEVTQAPAAPPGPSPMGCDSGRYMGDPSDCSRFFICVNGKPVSQKCAAGLEWNEEKSHCDWPFNVQCTQKKQQNQHWQQYLALTRDAMACTEDFQKHPTNCNKYYRCVHGKLQEEHCASGLMFNAASKICDWPDNSGCEGGSAASKPDTIPEYKPDPPPTMKPKPPSVVPVQSPTTMRPAPLPGVDQGMGVMKPGTDVAPAPCTGQCLMVCYFTNWAWYRPGTGKYLPEDIDPSLCTHIVYGFAVLDYENLIIKMHDSWADVDNRFYERVTALKKIGKKVLIAIGGWNDSAGDKYSRLVNNPAARTRFIKHVMEFMAKHNFDGLDLDWEYPKCWQVNCNKGPDSDKQSFADFIRELREAFDPNGYLLTAAVSPSKSVVDAGYDVPAVGKYLHYVSIMTYDFHGHWDKKTGHVAPLYFHPEDDFYYFNANYSIHYWNELGVPRCNIIMGMPLYGQSFTLTQASTNGLNAPATGPGQAGEFTRAAGFLSYYEICDRVKNRGYTVVKDSEGTMGPYAVKDRDWVSYDDVETLREKARYITKMGLGGGMIWALDLDDFRGTCGQGKYPLLNAINQELCKAPGGGGDSLKPPSVPSGPAPGKPTEAPFMPEEIPMKKPDKPVVITPPAKPEAPQAPEMPPPTVIYPITDQPGTAVATCDGKAPPCGSYKVVCYFTNWAWYRQGIGKYLPSDIDASLCTHIVYGFAVLDGGRLEIKPHDTWADFDNKFYEKVVAYKAKGVKVLLAIGGWNDSAGDKYSRLVNNPGARSRFISHVKEFIKQYNFDGLDLDWEYPVCWQVDCKKGPASDKQAFADFVRELRVAFNDNGGGEPLLLTSAVSPSKYVVDAGYNVASIAKDLDWIAVMTYDYHGQWDKITGHVAPMFAHPEDIDATFNANSSINYWIDQGAPPCKLVMGMPMYGQSFSLADNNKNGLNQATYGGGEAGESTRARGFLAYYEICSYIRQRGWKVVQDPLGTMGPYAYLRDQWVSFDDQRMIGRKTNLVKELGLAGAMIWALDLDDFRNVCDCEPHPLLKTINRGLCRLNTPAPDCSLSPPGSGGPSSDIQQVKPVKPVIPGLPDDPRLQGIVEEAASCDSSSRLMPHKTNCNHYYQCVNGMALERNCPPGTVFIPEKQNCGWATGDRKDCGGAPPQAPQRPDTVPEEAPMKPVTPPVTPATQRPTSSPPVTSAPTWPEVAQPAGQCSDTFQPRGDMRVICYFTNWAIYRPGVGKYRAEDIDENLCTHVLYGFAVLDGSTLTIKSHDPWADFDDGLALYSKVTALRSKGIKVLLALGGWNDSLGDKYSRLVSSPGSRSRFIKQALEFIDKYHFDGLDLDWEYPKCWQVDCNKGPDSDKENFASLVKELSAEFKPKGLLLSAAVSPSKAVIDAGYDVPVLSQYLDWISVMTYDYHGNWDKMTGHVAPFKVHDNDTNVYFNGEFTMNYYKKKGADPKKLVMGIPLYAQSFTLIDQTNIDLDSKSSGPGLAGEFTRAAGFVAFYEVCYNIKHQGWNVRRDPSGAMGPYAYKGNQWMSYDDVDIIRDKMAFVKSSGLGGAMIWALDLDDFTNRCGCGKYPLLRTINEELRGQGCKLNNCT